MNRFRLCLEFFSENNFFNLISNFVDIIFSYRDNAILAVMSKMQDQIALLSWLTFENNPTQLATSFLQSAVIGTGCVRINFCADDEGFLASLVSFGFF